MTRNWPTEEQAFKRVQALRRGGIWPGVIKIGTGTAWRLTYDPDVEAGDE